MSAVVASMSSTLRLRDDSLLQPPRTREKALALILGWPVPAETIHEFVMASLRNASFAGDPAGRASSSLDGRLQATRQQREEQGRIYSDGSVYLHHYGPEIELVCYLPRGR